MKSTDPKPTRRPFLTPSWLIFGLLVVEGLLWLSERYTWFWFNEKKGWTVLIGVAVVGGAMLVMLLWFLTSLLFRWRFQFSIRSLLVMTVAVAMPCGWLAREMKKARDQKELVQEIKHLGGLPLYDYQVDASGDRVYGEDPPEPVWLRKLVGDDFFANVALVYLSGCAGVTVADLERIKGLTVLRFLYLGGGGTPITDVGLQHLKGLTFPSDRKGLRPACPGAGPGAATARSRGCTGRFQSN